MRFQEKEKEKQYTFKQSHIHIHFHIHIREVHDFMEHPQQGFCCGGI